VLDCVRKNATRLSSVERLIHGSTIAINTLIERKGARTALLVTRGTRDAYAIGRGNRPDAFNLRFRRPRPLVPRADIFEIDERCWRMAACTFHFRSARSSKSRKKSASEG